MAISFDQARAAAREIVNLRRGGYGSSVEGFQLRLLFPGINGFEINRAKLRATAIIANEDAIRAGMPPVIIDLPYPLPPSSMGPNSPPNQVTIDANVEIDMPTGPTQYRIVRSTKTIPHAWDDFEDDFDFAADGMEESYGADSATVSNYARTIF